MSGLFLIMGSSKPEETFNRLYFAILYNSESPLFLEEIGVLSKEWMSPALGQGCKC